MPNTPNLITEPRPDFRELSDMGFSSFILPRGKKTPSMAWKGYQQTRPSAEEIEDWQGTISNVAIVTGRISNLVVVDVDSPEAQALIDKFELPKTPTVLTSRGRHYFFKHPAVEIKNKVRLMEVELDIRGEGGYVVGPGSKHPDGTIYQWEVSPQDYDIAELPTKLLNAFTEPRSKTELACKKPTTEFLEVGVFNVWFNREINEQITELRGASAGERNDTLFRVAVALANHVAALGLEWALVADALRPEALSTGLTGNETDRTLQSAWETGSKTPTEWLKIARSWIFVANPNCFWSPATRQELKTVAFSMQFAEKRPYSKVNLAKFLTDNGLIEKVLDFTFEPSQPSGVFAQKGENFFNVYRAPMIEAAEGDWSPLTEFLEYLIPVASERDHLTKMIAWSVANPGEKLSYALLLQSKEHGVGKTTLIEIWRKLLGDENTRKTNSEEMDGDFQSYLKNTLLVVLEELNLGRGIGAYNRLKDMITGETAVVNVKYLASREIPNYANFVFLSNLDAPIFIEQADRRFYVLDTPAERRPAEYWTEFYGWWKNNLGVVKAYFDSIDLTDFESKAVPPMTPAKERLMRQSEAPLVQNLRELIADMNWPLREVCTIDDIRRAMKDSNLKRETSQRLSMALKELGCIPLGQIRVPAGRASLWALERPRYWAEASLEERRTAYEKPASHFHLSEEAA